MKSAWEEAPQLMSPWIPPSFHLAGHVSHYPPRLLATNWGKRSLWWRRISLYLLASSFPVGHTTLLGNTTAQQGPDEGPNLKTFIFDATYVSKVQRICKNREGLCVAECGSNSRLTPNLTQLSPLTDLGNSTSCANASGDVYDSWAMMEAVQICIVMRGPAKKVWWRPSTRSVWGRSRLVQEALCAQRLHLASESFCRTIYLQTYQRSHFFCCQIVFLAIRTIHNGWERLQT